VQSDLGLVVRAIHDPLPQGMICQGHTSPVGLLRWPGGPLGEETDRVINSRSASSAPAGYRFPREVIAVAVRWYLRYGLSYRDVEELLAERGLDISYETVRRWVLKFGPLIAQRLRRHRPRPSDRWHLDDMVVRIAGKRMYLWLSTTRARSSTCLFSAGATLGRHCD
jgi:transposase